MAIAPDAFEARVVSPAPRAEIQIAGELSMVSAPALRAVLAKAVAEQPDAVVLDLSGLRVREELALTLFATLTREACDLAGCALLLCVPDGPVLDALHRTGLSRDLRLYATRAAAVAAAAGDPSPLRFRERCAPTADATRQARILVTRACRAWGHDDLANAARLIVAELASNAWRHAGTTMEVSVTLREPFLHLRVRDGHQQLPVRAAPAAGGTGPSRGLLLVDALAAAWGATRTADGKVVWATLRTNHS